MTSFKPDEWLIVEDRYLPRQNRFNETIFFLGNGYMGVRGTPEEGFPEENSSPFTFVAPIYDLVESGAWRVPFVKECSVMVKCIDWFSINVTLNGSRFNPLEGKVTGYKRTLDLKHGTVVRRMVWEDSKNRKTEIEVCRIVSQDNRHIGAIRYGFRPLNYSGVAQVECALDGFNTPQQRQAGIGAIAQDGAWICTRTLKTQYETATAMRTRITVGGKPVRAVGELTEAGTFAARRFVLKVKEATVYFIEKVVAVCTSRDNEAGSPRRRAISEAARARRQGFARLLDRHMAAWERIWQGSDVTIEGDPAAQQGIRLCIFNMHQNYAGDDPLVNMAAKGLSGPGYGGLYWWDTEMYMLPFFVYTDPPKARNLVLYRYRTIDGARHKARLMGYEGAMYPWVTIDGEERSGDWEYGMFEQHVTSAVAYGVHRYVEATGDLDFLWDYGAEILLETSRFWASRVYLHPRRKQYVINAVTGPDEYAVNVNNNCYTNAMAQFNLELGVKVAARMKKAQPQKWRRLALRLALKDDEPARWRRIARRMYIPFDEELGVHKQDDAFPDRDAIDAASIPKEQFPLMAKWPWERVMRHQVIKQADVVLLMYLLNDRFPAETKRANYDFYEPKTTHDSSLSPCIHSIMAAEVGHRADAFNYYLRSARLDLDDVNGNTDQGFHIANMAGSWMSIVNGFAGMRLAKGRLSFNPQLPARWRRLSFTMQFRGRSIQIEMRKSKTTFTLKGKPLSVAVGGRKVQLKQSTPAAVEA